MRQMKNWTKYIISLLFLLLCQPLQAQQQITGVVVDAETGEVIPMASLIYKGHNVAKVADADGRFSITRHEGWNLTVSSIGYKERIIRISAKTRDNQKITLKPDKQQLEEVTVKSKRHRYSRKDNPAVELMRKVIAAKKQTDLKTHDYYQYNLYEKLTLGLNDLTPEQLEQKPFSKHPWLLDQVERCQYNNKLILPVSVDETVKRKVYRREPHAEKTYIIGQQSTGVNDLFQTGDIINVVMKDVFTDVNLYDDQIRLLQYPFTSPIGKNAIGFYRFYIEDTLKIDRDTVIHLHFLPNNQQDFGFRGDLYILKDSTYHVRRCELTLPKKSDVNFVENLRVEQEFSKLENGEWVLTRDDMITEMKFAKFLKKDIVIRTTRLTDYDFSEQPKELYKGKQTEVKDAYAELRSEQFWNQYRQVELTKSESSMDTFLQHIKDLKGFKYFMFGLKALIENSIETGNPNKIDLSPVNTILTHNEFDGMRSRLSALTTANLNKHLFASAYYAHGWGSHKNYYNAELTYSLNAKEYLPWEYPKRTLYVGSTYDVCSPSDKFLPTDKDNFLLAWKWTGIDKMILYNRQRIGFDYEWYGGLRTSLELKAEEYEACGKMSFRTLDKPRIDYQGMDHHREFLRTTELKAELRYAKGETFVNSKERRVSVNRDAPVFTLSHTWGMRNVLGADYTTNFTEAKIYKRFWLNSWGKVDVRLKGGIQWNQVPYLLLILPMANQSFVIEDEMFNLINNMEFLNDRYASLLLSWDMNGKLFNRIPLVRRLKCREFIAINMLWGGLSDKNNPYLPQNAGSSRLMYFPEGCHVMDTHKPYAELVIGIHNIFKILQIEYVRRLTYLDLPTSEKWGIRYTFRMTF
ncbi:MAG: carboxypeptidase-like regulatory domain-containing protein [Prevotella sp.]|nr:carboxypeptidase-like regulatory domain-containing protein [Prevotella sp.]